MELHILIIPGRFIPAWYSVLWRRNSEGVNHCIHAILRTAYGPSCLIHLRLFDIVFFGKNASEIQNSSNFARFTREDSQEKIKIKEEAKLQFYPCNYEILSSYVEFHPFSACVSHTAFFFFFGSILSIVSVSLPRALLWLEPHQNTNPKILLLYSPWSTPFYKRRRRWMQKGTI